MIQIPRGDGKKPGEPRDSSGERYLPTYVPRVLSARQKAWDDMKPIDQQGTKRPGSQKR